MMGIYLQAIYENGMLRPLQPLALAEGQEVTITINEHADPYQDNTDIVLQPDEWDAFCELLERPPREIPALRKLLTEPSVFDGEQTA
ncbi:MAG TPA: antitoxin AF2212-like protein [Gemmataceae bacterium]|nr:antitoxin AF2212-like protein [Gemmataceae bacterium]